MSKSFQNHTQHCGTRRARNALIHPRTASSHSHTFQLMPPSTDRYTVPVTVRENNTSPDVPKCPIHAIRSSISNRVIAMFLSEHIG
mmetsp:Transcript_22649/g.38436  ORF Transcript_22649/g.38436 Transcript_22649/m.38436 type:complete len:86 (-) Transcript_22649:101-358(-)